MRQKGENRFGNKDATKNRKKRLQSKPKLKSKLKSKSESGKLTLKNLPFKVTEKELKEYLHNFGTITDVKILKKSNGASTGRGVIEFDDNQSATKAVENCNGKEFMGRRIVVALAVPNSGPGKSKNQSNEKMNGSGESTEINEGNSAQEIKKKKKNKIKKNKMEYVKDVPQEDIEIKEEDSDFEEDSTQINNKKKNKKMKKAGESKDFISNESEKSKNIKKDPLNEDSDYEEEIEVRKTKNIKKKFKTKNFHDKERKKAQNFKKSRLIVRNLSFKITEEVFQNHFKKYGDIKEVTLLRRGDGKLVGCGFIQFSNKNCAAKAILECSGKPLLGRPIIVDWAVAKSVFTAKQPKNIEKIEVKKEEDSEEVDEKEIKPLLSDENVDEQPVEVKEEPLSEESEEETKNTGSENEESDEETENDFEQEVSAKKPKVVSNDVEEGRTVFVKNVPFAVTNEELKSCMEKFGKVVYALICIDPVTEHSKGTAFVKFQKKESAEECLSAGTELTLRDQTLDVFRALNKEDLQKKMTMKQEKKKDNRNLYLVKEGVVIAGSKSAEGVSMQDMAKRLQLEQWKTQMLRNLNMFVSRTRLIVHNLPPSWTEDKLRQLFLKHAGPKAVIKEARIMRDKRNFDANGLGISKEYGFVSFENCENALEALRNINNNPNIFTPVKRPIVAFSIENRAIMNLKQRRLEKSRLNNPLYSKEIIKSNSKKSKSRYQNENLQKEQNDDTERVKENFVGIISKPGKVKMRRKFRPKEQAKLHSEMIHKAKRKEKLQRKMNEFKNIAKEKMKDFKMKEGTKRKREDKNESTFNDLVNKYKKKLMAAPLKKWYDE